MNEQRQGKFERDDVEELREQLLEIGGDYQGASELILAFIHGRGYGLSPESARRVALQIGINRCSLAAMQTELDQAAMVV